MKLALATAAAMLALAAPAAADDSFGGSCTEIEGVATFDVPLTREATDNAYHFKGTGKCTGTLNGQPVTDAPIDAQVDGKFNGSCESGASTEPGPGKLVFNKGTPDTADDVTILFTMTFEATLSEVDFVLKGQKSGEATGHASFLTERTPPDMALKCLSGGNSELPFDAESETSSPLTSEAPSKAPQPSTPGAQNPSQPSGGAGQGRPGGGGTGPGGGAGANGQNATGVSVEVAEQSLADVIAKGLQVTCRAPRRAKCVLTLLVDKATAKKLRLGTRRLGAGNVKVAGDQGATTTVKLSRKARKRLKQADSVKVRVVGKVSIPGQGRRTASTWVVLD